MSLSPEFLAAAIARVNKCKPSPLRIAMLKNLQADSFLDEAHAEANVADLERQDKESSK